MDKQNNSDSGKLQENIDTAVKKIIVPVALTVGILGNQAAADSPADMNSGQAQSSEYLSSEGFDYGVSPIDFDASVEEDEDDEEKRSFKGKNLALSSASASLITFSAVPEMSLGEYAGSLILSLLAVSARFIGVFAMLSVLFMGLFKAIYPARKLKEIINGKNVFRLLIASIVLFGVMYIADELTDVKNIFLELMKNGALLGGILILWYKVFELKGGFGQVMKDLFWGKKGKLVFAGIVCFNVFMSVLHIIYNTFRTTNSFTSLVVFYIISVITVFGVYEMCKGRMVEDDELTEEKSKL